MTMTMTVIMMTMIYNDKVMYDATADVSDDDSDNNDDNNAVSFDDNDD